MSEEIGQVGYPYFLDMPLTRMESKYEYASHKYQIKEFDYQKQFSHLYAHRLAEMTQLLEPLARKKWGKEISLKKLCELREDQEDNCILIGTIYKHQSHKPSILREISEENQLAPQPPRQNYADPEDKLILEDELQRVRLQGKVVSTKEIATGVVCAVLGSIEEDGRFDVEEWLFYEGGPQKPLSQLGKSRFLVLVSGLSQINSLDYADELNMFQYWLGGSVGSETRGKSLVRLIVAGNSVRSSAEQRVPSLQTRNTDASDTVEAVRELDTWFASWSQTITLDVMPGAYDPANFMLPQQPFHACMFPESANNASFRSVPNPYACYIDDALITGCSGQNVADLLRSTQLDKNLDALRNTLIWSHLAPTAPDTLSCYPYIDSDPFILRECPHVYFAGNCSTFETELHTGTQGTRTRIICVPSFSETKSIAVVDLETLDCHQVSFSVID